MGGGIVGVLSYYVEGCIDHVVYETASVSRSVGGRVVVFSGLEVGEEMKMHWRTRSLKRTSEFRWQFENYLLIIGWHVIDFLGLDRASHSRMQKKKGGQRQFGEVTG